MCISSSLIWHYYEGWNSENMKVVIIGQNCFTVPLLTPHVITSIKSRAPKAGIGGNKIQICIISVTIHLGGSWSVARWQFWCSGKTSRIKGKNMHYCTLADHCYKCPAKFVNNIYVTGSISHILVGLSSYLKHCYGRREAHLTARNSVICCSRRAGINT